VGIYSNYTTDIVATIRVCVKIKSFGGTMHVLPPLLLTPTILSEYVCPAINDQS
jgi:flagellar motor switch protein FliM